MSLLSFLFQAPKPASYSNTSFPGELCWFPDKIPCLWVPKSGSDTVLIYLHGNASDLGTDRDFVWRMSQGLEVNVLAIEFSGYGPVVSWELPTEQNLFQRVRLVCSHLSRMSDIKSIVILGYSLGASAAIHLAANTTCNKVKALILYSPFSSLHDLLDDVTNNRIVSGALKHLVPNHVFHNHQTIQNIRIPIGIFHGSQDQLIPLRHARQLATANPQARLFVLPNVTHNISQNSRSETELFVQTKDYLTKVIPRSRNFSLTTSHIEFPPTYWIAPTLITKAKSCWGFHMWFFGTYCAAIGLTVLLVIALFMLRQCKKTTR